MVDVISKRCTGADCEAKPLAQRKQPSYAREGAKAAFCKACAAHDPLMINAHNRRCTAVDCEAKPLRSASARATRARAQRHLSARRAPRTTR